MSLTVGTGPFGNRPAGTFNTTIDPPGALLFWDPVPHRVRAIFAGETVVDSTNVKMLHETGHLPVYYFPEEDLRADLLEPSEHSTHCPVKGEATYRSIRAGGRVAENAVWAYPEPIESAPFLVGHANLVDAKRGERAGETAVEAQGADAEAVAIGEIIFPDQEAAGGFEGKLGMDLVAGQGTGDGILAALIGEAALGGNQRGDGHGQARQHRPPARRPEKQHSAPGT